MICKMRDWEAGESLVNNNAHPQTLEALERNAMQFLKDLHRGDPSIVTITVQVLVEISLNPDKRSELTSATESASGNVYSALHEHKAARNEINLQSESLGEKMATYRLEAIERVLLREEAR